MSAIPGHARTGEGQPGDAVSPTPRVSRLVDRRLRTIGILLPVGFAIALEVVRSVLERRGYWSPGVFEAWHVATLGLVIAGIVVFALFMFRLIDRTERQVLSQNRDLTAANAVAAAIQGQATVPAIVDGALGAMLRTAGATQVRIRFFDTAGLPEEDARTQTLTAGGVTPSDDNPSLDVPLTHGPTTVGRLAVWYPPGTDVTERIGSAALSSLTTQIACAVQLAQAVGDLNRRKVEGHGLYDILLRVSNQEPTTAILDAVARHAVRLLGADAAAITINPETAQSVRFESGPDAPTLRSDGAALVAHGLPVEPPADGVESEATDPTDDALWARTARHDVSGGAGVLGEIWVARTTDSQFSDRDRGFLATLASLVGIALTGAQMREGARQRAVLNERTRIAREMHDSLAQVLGAVHLRLRALETNVDLLPQDRVVAEIEALADVCAEAYRDVREAILGLRDAHQHAERSLEDNLRAYLGKYSDQCGIAATLANEVGHEVSLSPRAEVHVIRIVQEALTNVRKHARASSVVVRIRGTESMTSFAVEDDGAGFDSDATSRSKDGYGLFTMRDRAALLGGTVEIDSVVGRGTRVTATVPERPYPPRPVRSPA